MAKGKRHRFQSPPPEDPISAVRDSSLAFRLNFGFFFRQLGVFLLMDLLLFVLATVGMFLYAENRCAQVAGLVAERGVPSADALAWMEASDYTITPLDPDAWSAGAGRRAVLPALPAPLSGAGGRGPVLGHRLLLHGGAAQRRGALRHHGGHDGVARTLGGAGRILLMGRGSPWSSACSAPTARCAGCSGPSRSWPTPPPGSTPPPICPAGSWRAWRGS